ncbi:lysylphosphatidylglycerol synthase transmembrane domain-containing protein [Actinomadura craniellae]|uniref:lysylphosphatidylglycerol synthase transmembrane domain-containing protein n=1 Tax=Actinomadura craniellae TaxID=2231787 RepID=UPI001314D8DB|nr:lysylphosphatidylglycerol synthase transmembrane domain-containing protein [Actinomadura craniellae]
MVDVTAVRGHAVEKRRLHLSPGLSPGFVLKLSLLLVGVVSVVLLADKLPDLDAVRAAAARAEPGWLALLVLAELGSMGAFAWLQHGLLRGGGVGISRRRAFAVTYAGNALSTTLPAGPAVSVVYTFRQWRGAGASAQLATAVILIGGVVTSVAYTVVALAALLAEPASRTPVLLGLAALAVAAVPLLRWRGRLLGPVLRHPRIAPQVDRLRSGWAALRLSPRAWGALTTLALANWLLEILALFAAARAVGLDVPPHVVALAYFAAQAAGSVLPILPGGLGAVEGGMLAALLAFGVAAAPAGAAIILYRLVSHWGVLAAGWLAWLLLHGMPEPVLRLLRALPRALGTGLASLGVFAPYAGTYRRLG